jgi:hypothetical protein
MSEFDFKVNCWFFAGRLILNFRHKDTHLIIINILT